jgi:cyclohexyl-isocyanide hydratase
MAMIGEEQATIVIGFPLFDDADLMDVTGPVEMLGSLPLPKIEIKLIGRSTEKPVRLSPGDVRVLPDASFASCPPLTVLVVPGGYGILETFKDRQYLDFLREHASRARYVVGVCAGALVLAVAGLLDGHVATTHWASLSILGLFPKVTLAPGYPRYVISGNRVTTGGVTSGLDMSLALAAMLRGEAQAKEVQLLTQYAPRPPYHAGDPDTADPVTWDQASLRLEKMRQQRIELIRKILGLGRGETT